MTEEWTYDLFVSYVEADKNWVEGYLLDALKNAKIRYTLESAFALGVPRILEFERAIRQSRATLLVISETYLGDDLRRFTDILAQSYGEQEGTWPVIPLTLQDGLKLPPGLKMLNGLKASSNTEEWDVSIDRLCDELKLPPPPPPPKPVCPYPGMNPFNEKDKERFFGRGAEIEELLNKLRLKPFLTVIGASGSGKSSLVFAGLIPKLKQSGLFGTGQWCVRSFRPGKSPLANLQAVLGGDVTALEVRIEQLLSTELDAQRLLLVVDQFEELFTQGGTEGITFQQTLLRLMEIPNVYLVLTVRADFYVDLMGSLLWEKMSPARRFEVLPLDTTGLKQAIVEPAKGVDVYVDPVLVERLLVDAKGEPGVLPLIQETLVLLWDKLKRRFLPFNAYELLVLSRPDYGATSNQPRTGLQVAIAFKADNALDDLGTEEKQAIARRIFLRLIQFGEGRADTRRQQSKSSLASGNKPLLFEETLDHLVNSRLLTLSGEEKSQDKQVDIAHEALISGWPKLGGSEGWIRRRREKELTRRRLESKVQEWVKQQRGLLDKDELADAQNWLSSQDAQELDYSDLLQELVNKSKKEIQKSEFLRWSGIAVILASILGAGWWTLYQNQKALLDSYTLWSGYDPSSSDLKLKFLQDRLRLPFLQDRLTDADNYKNKAETYTPDSKETKENWQRAIAYYRQIKSETPDKPSGEWKKLDEKSEYGVSFLMYKYGLKELENKLKKKEFGSSPDIYIPKEYDQGFKGAMNETYKVLRLSDGIGADMNRDGTIDTAIEASVLPCDTLKRIDYLWHKYTEQKCGWFSDSDCRDFSPQGKGGLIDYIFSEVVDLNGTDVISMRFESCKIDQSQMKMTEQEWTQPPPSPSL
jgi:hypothetical protein